MADIKYLNGNPLDGRAHDWAGAIKLWNKLSKKHMGESYESKFHFANINTMWQVYMSPRDMGKTTNILGVGVILHKWTDLQIGYTRNAKTEVTESKVSNLFGNIEANGYIEEIYEGKYNTVIYRKNDRAFYLAFRDEAGKITEEDHAPLCHIHSLDVDPEATKSGYVQPYEDLIIYDEFIPVNGITTENNFLGLQHMLSSITRERISCRYYLLANTITAQTHIFHELEIYNDVQQMKVPECRLVTAQSGLQVYVEYISLVNGAAKQKRLDRLLFKFGFKNPKLSSITGDTKAEIQIYPHLPRKLDEETRTKMQGYIYITMYGRYFRVSLENSSRLGEYAYCYEVYETPKEDAIVYTMQPPTALNERFGFSENDLLDKYIFGLYKAHRWLYSYNDVGSALDTYIWEVTGKKWR